MEPLIRVRVLVAYDGSSFHGFAYQNKDLPTVAGALRIALGRLSGSEPDLAVSGRTDAGVHAWGQVVSLDFPQRVVDKLGFERIQRSLNKQMHPFVVVREIAPAPPDFDARFSATRRSYRYTILNAPTPSPFLAATAWWLPDALDLEAMNSACGAIVGEHDFSAFCRRPDNATHLIRRVVDARWLRLADEIVRLDISALAFCHQMVRSLTAMCVEIGKGKRPPDDMARVLAGRDRRNAASPAPPQGLCLWKVDF